MKAIHYRLRMKQSINNDFYQIFQLPRTVSQQKIKPQFRRLVLQFHPDRTNDPEASTHIHEIYEAYAILSDPEKRRDYDIQNFGYSFWVDDIPIKIEFYKNNVKMDVHNFDEFVREVKRDLSKDRL